MSAFRSGVSLAVPTVVAALVVLGCSAGNTGSNSCVEVAPTFVESAASPPKAGEVTVSQGDSVAISVPYTGVRCERALATLKLDAETPNERLLVLKQVSAQNTDQQKALSLTWTPAGFTGCHGLTLSMTTLSNMSSDEHVIDESKAASVTWSVREASTPAGACN